jgi:urea carboxylase
VTTKYNPARTWTPENAVGIGGAYLCVYGMEGPGGYQLFGRTLQMWNRWRRTECFEQPWLLRFFDQIRFYPVSADELLEAREAFIHGRYPLKVEPARFSLKSHEAFLTTHEREITAFKSRQQSAFEEERGRWRDQGLDTYISEDAATLDTDEEAVPEGLAAVHADATGTVWKTVVEEGQTVSAGQPLVIIESMKMEITIAAMMSGVVRKLVCQPGRIVKAGQIVALIESKS